MVRHDPEELTPEYWEAKAAECRRAIAATHEPDAIRSLLERATEYERIARELRAKRGDGSY